MAAAYTWRVSVCLFVFSSKLHSILHAVLHLAVSRVDATAGV